MQKLPKPSDDPSGVFLYCIRYVKDSDLRNRLEAVKDMIAADARSYEAQATAARLFQFKSVSDVRSIVSDKELKDVYTNRMAKRNSPGRSIYNKLLSAPAHGICPLCGQRVVSTLDHYLPASLFPLLVVVPSNLVPSCYDCNKAKLDAVPSKADEQTLHPYFDDVGNDTWLFAKVIEEKPAVVSFFVEPPAQWDLVMAARVKHHFKKLGLAKLYTSHAGNELRNIEYQLSHLYGDAGAKAVENHLRREARSRVAANCNSWQAAMLTALADSTWYCSGGFNLT